MQKNNKKTTKAIMITSDSSDVLHIYNDDIYISIPTFDRFKSSKGNFEKKILLLCLENDLNEANTITIEKMMTSCKLQIDDYAVVYLKHEDEALEALQQFRPEKAILFGLPLQNNQLQISKTWYKPFKFNQITIIQSDSLSILNQKPELKMTLWNPGLKILFKIA